MKEPLNVSEVLFFEKCRFALLFTFFSGEKLY